MLTVLVKVTHLGLSVVTRSVYGLFDDIDLALVGRARRRRRVNGGTGDVNGLLVGGTRDRTVNGVFVDVAVGLVVVVVVSEAGAVDGRADYGSFLVVVGLDTGTILALGNVDDRVVGAVLVIELDTSLGVGLLRPDVGSGWLVKGRRRSRMFVPGSACFSSHLVPGSTQPPLAPDRLGEAALNRVAGDGWPRTDQKEKAGKPGKAQVDQNKTKTKQNKDLRGLNRINNGTNELQLTCGGGGGGPRGKQTPCGYRDGGVPPRDE